MAASIPAARIVSILPNVLSAGGTGLDLVGLLLTSNAQLPVGAVLPFVSAADVAAYFGPLSTEATLAATYFAGYTGSSVKPAQLVFARYATAAVGAYLRGGSLAALSLSALQALTGVLTISVGGTAKTSATIDLSSVASFSAAAAAIQAAFTTPGFTVSFDSVSGAFVFQNTATGSGSTISFATGSLADGLRLTQATGSVLSQGSAISAPGAAMDAVVAATQDFVSFATTWQPVDADKLAFSAWASAQTDRYLYVAWDDNSAATEAGDTTSFGAQVVALGYASTAAVYDPSNGANVAAFVMGAIASINFGAVNGRATLAFKSGAVLPGVTNATIAANLIANGYNFVGRYATANDGFVFLYPGQVSGKFKWIDSWVSQVWLNNGFQLALMELLTNVGSIPYNADGYGLIEASLAAQIEAALSFGAIRAGVTLSETQAAEINNAAGLQISDTIQQRGWYILVGDASAQVRAARGSPPIFVWWTDGESVHQITVSSVSVQ